MNKVKGISTLKWMIFSLLMLASGFWFLISSCGTTYIRYTDLPHVECKYSVTLLPNEHIKLSTRGCTEWDTLMTYHICDSGQLITPKNECLLFLEDKKVIHYNGSFWIKKGKLDSITRKYVN